MSKPWSSWAGITAAAGVTGWMLWRRQQQKKATAALPPFNLRYGPWAIVTGAARAEGLGYGFARHLAGQQINLVLVDILADDLTARSAELRQKYMVKVKPVALDLGQPDFITQLLAETDGLEIGLLVCNHMFTPTDTPPILDMDLATHHRMLDINLCGRLSIWKMCRPYPYIRKAHLCEKILQIPFEMLEIPIRINHYPFHLYEFKQGFPS